MLALLVLSVAAVSAQYGSGPSNNPPAQSYPSNPVYYPPAVYDSVYYDYSSREHKKCPKLKTFLGELPGIPAEAFYPPVIRYAKYDGKWTALVACDRDTRNINMLFARHNKSQDIRKTHLVALGTTAGITLKCDRDERRFKGTVLDLTDTYPTGDFSKTEEITQLTCLGLDKTAIGLITEVVIKGLAIDVIEFINDNYLVPPTRKKREAVDEPTASTGAPAAAITEKVKATEAVTEAKVEAAAVTTQATIKKTDAAATDAEVANTEAPVVATTERPSKQLGKLLGQIFGQRS
ncbi:hypothetical protein CRE_10583 [Caenorhabditis remanei]|uniref:Uncharacterized protein n=1 Tax=Caenorhabditis remanei TaxID=31234 RepID=E3N796_CAERE|nr:hypothetical protein CRE_10583 [Caenorhabditis remanei]